METIEMMDGDRKCLLTKTVYFLQFPHVIIIVVVGGGVFVTIAFPSRIYTQSTG